MTTGVQLDRRSLLALLGVGGLSACARATAPAAGGTSTTVGPTSSAPTSTAPARDEALAALTRQMTRAMTSGDKRAFLEAFAPSATAARRDAGRWWDVVQGLPMSHRSLVPVSGADGWRLPQGSTPWTFAFRHQLTGVDLVPVEEWYGAPLVTTPSGMRLGGWGGVKDVDPDTEVTYVGYYRQLWDDGPVRFAARRHAALMTDADMSAERHRRLLETMDEAVGRTSAILTQAGVTTPLGPVLISIANTKQHKLLDYMGGTRSAPVASYSGFSCALPHLDDQHQEILDRPAISARIVVDPADMPDDEETGLLIRHESAHALLSMAWGAQDARVPWTVEGITQYCEVDGDDDLRALGLAAAAECYPHRLRSVDAVDYWSGSQQSVDDSYALAYAAFAFVAETRGVDRAVAMMRPTFPGGDGDPYQLGGFADVRAFDQALLEWLELEA